MLTLNECVLSDTRFLLVKPDDGKKKISLIKPKEKKMYRKNFNHAEFVGEQLCGLRNLKCAHYFLIGEGHLQVNRVARYGELRPSWYEFKLASYDFKEPMHQYFDLDSFEIPRGDYPNALAAVLSMAPNEKNRKELMNEIEEMFALDIYMGQTDRIPSNIMFQRNMLGEIHLAPLYDFQYSLKGGYGKPSCIYDNALFPMKNKKQMKEFLQEHPEFVGKLEEYLDMDLTEAVRWGYRAKGLKVPEPKFEYYRQFEEERKELIKNIARIH